MRIRWSEGAELQRDEARLRQSSSTRLRQLNRKLRETLELIEQFPEAAKPHPDYNRSDIRMAVVGEYRMSYIILEDEIIVISFVLGKSNTAHD